jgi:hypothetical protein
MRPFLDGVCALAIAVAIAGGSAAAANSEWTPVDKGRAAAPIPARSAACLGGVLNERDASNYLTVADYPAFAALTTDLLRVFICGDSIPPFLPANQRASFASHHH